MRHQVFVRQIWGTLLKVRENSPVKCLGVARIQECGMCGV